MSRLDRAAMQRASATGPEVLASRREEAWAAFDEMDMPNPKAELWRYVDLDLDIDELELATPGDALGAPSDGIGASLDHVSASATVVDGVVEVSSGATGATVARLADVDDSQWLESRYGTLVTADVDKFSAAHAAFGSDGVVIRVPKGSAPSGVMYVDVQATGAGVSFPHVVIDCDEGSQADVVVNYRSPDDVAAVPVPQIEMYAGDGVNLSVSIVQNWGYGTVAIGHGRARVGRDSTLRVAEAGVGARFSRFHLMVDLEGRGSSAHVVGAYFGDKSQVLDYRYFMHHAGLNTSSDMFLKGAVEDEALSVFTGMIRIDEGAQRTDAYQTNRNLILSEGAAAQSVPNLEILANDVKCGHGSTVGPLDAEQRYYLMSRGLERSAADRLQVRGFFEDALGRFPDQRIADPVRRWINAKFVNAQREGRV